MDDLSKKIETFFQSKAFGVVGASANQSKYGNKVLRCYLQYDKTVYPVHPKEKAIEGIDCVSRVSDLPTEVESLSIVTPPSVTETIIEEAIQKKIKNIWMQPGSESDKAIAQCEQHHINVISKGPCVLVVLGFKEAE